jgi:hypothetical protein
MSIIGETLATSWTSEGSSETRIATVSAVTCVHSRSLAEIRSATANVRKGSLAAICSAQTHVRLTPTRLGLPYPRKRTCGACLGCGNRHRNHLDEAVRLRDLSPKRGSSESATFNCFAIFRFGKAGARNLKTTRRQSHGRALAASRVVRRTTRKGSSPQAAAVTLV